MEVGKLLIQQALEMEKNTRIQETCVKNLFHWWTFHNPVDKMKEMPEKNQLFVNLLVQLPKFMRSKSVNVKT